jgi:hypothetical protein
MTGVEMLDQDERYSASGWSRLDQSLAGFEAAGGGANSDDGNAEFIVLLMARSRRLNRNGRDGRPNIRLRRSFRHSEYPILGSLARKRAAKFSDHTLRSSNCLRFIEDGGKSKRQNRLRIEILTL